MLGFTQRLQRRWYSVDYTIAVIAPLVLSITFFFLFNLFTVGLKGFPHINESGHAQNSVSARRQAMIEETFDFAWDGYFKLAFPHDEVKPRSEEPGFSRNDWGASAVDALGTAILMKKADVVKIILDHVQTINFSRTDWSISVFETTIRYLGGMLSAYDLLNGPFMQLVSDRGSVQSLLDKSVQLGNILSKAFVRDNALPYPRLTANAEGVEGTQNSLAGAGTLVLEWSRLSDLTGDKHFETSARTAEGFLLIPMPKKLEPLPGLVGTKIDVKTGLFADQSGGWGGSCDSFYEYLIKMYAYDPSTFAIYKDRWILAAESTMLHLASSPKGLPDITFLGKFSGSRSLPESGHMECFAGGNFLFGGRVLGAKKYTDFGLKLVEGCHHLYNSTATKIGPEAFRWVPSECDDPSHTRWLCDWEPKFTDAQMNNEKNFWITEPSYNLRPEVIESYYYAYRITKDEKYRDWAWDTFVAINATTRMNHGFTFYQDVRQINGPVGNTQESYFFSETLKYLWLIFDDRTIGGEWHVNATFGQKDGWVYNTEGHPLRVR